MSRNLSHSVIFRNLAALHITMETDRQTDRLTETDRQTDRQTNRDRQTD